jgi:hypothetical protein
MLMIDAADGAEAIRNACRRLVIVVVMVMVMVVMMAGARRVGMRLAGRVRGSGDRRAGDAKAQNQGSQDFFHKHISFMRAPGWGPQA